MKGKHNFCGGDKCLSVEGIPFLYVCVTEKWERKILWSGIWEALAIAIQLSHH